MVAPGATANVLPRSRRDENGPITDFAGACARQDASAKLPRAGASGCRWRSDWRPELCLSGRCGWTVKLWYEWLEIRRSAKSPHEATRRWARPGPCQLPSWSVSGTRDP